MTQPLQPAGVQAAVVNLNGFLSDLGRMNTGMIQMGDIAVKVTNRISASGQAFGGVSQKINIANQAITAVSGGIGMLGSVVGTVAEKTLGFFSNLASTALGFLTRDIIGGIARQFSGLTKTISESATNLQLLTVRLDNLIGRQLRAADSTLTYAQSMEKVKNITRETLDWMIQLAFTTPFSIDKISNTVSLGLAMDFTLKETRDLTKAMLDFVAGAGLQNETIERIIYNLAQMKNQAKVTGTELRDLGRGAMVPILDVLKIAAKNLGVTVQGMEEFRDAAAEGRISVDEFFKAFIEFAGIAFPDAATKMNNTMIALKDNILDFFKIQLGWNTFGAVVARAADILNDAFKKLVTPEVTNMFKLLGKSILFLFDSIIDAGREAGIAIRLVFNAFGIQLPTLQGFLLKVTQAITLFGAAIQWLGNQIYGFTRTYILPFIDGITNTMGGTLVDTANKAFTWGANIIISLAEGIIKAAAAALEAAMNFISKLFASWLAPGSPPKILPKIAEWGAKTFAEFLRGFSMADFSVLDSLQNALKGSLDALVSLGELGDKAGESLFKNLSKDLIAAIANFNKTGKIGEDIFKKLAKVGGGFGAELVDLLRKQVALAKATEAAEKAQKALNAAQDATKAATANVNKLVRQYNDLLRAGADKATLKTKLKAVNAAEAELDAARKREKAAELANDAAKKALDPLKEAVSLQEKLIQELIELAKAQKEAAGGKDGGGGGGIDIPPIDMGGIGDSIEKGLDDLFELIKKNMLAKLGGIWDALEAWWNAQIQPIIDRILAKWKPLWDQLVAFWEIVKEKLLTIWNNLKKFWDEHGPGIMKAATKVFTVIATVAGFIAGKMLLFLLDTLVKISQWFVDNGPGIETFAANVAAAFEWMGLRVQASWPTIEGILILLVDWLLTTGTVVLDLANGDWAKAWEDMKAATKTNVDNIVDVSLKYLENSLDLLGIKVDLSLKNIQRTGNAWGIGFRLWWSDHWDQIKEKVTTIIDTVKAYIEEKLRLLFEKMGLNLGVMRDRWSAIWEDVKLIATTIWDAIKLYVETKIGEVKSNIETKIGEIKANWDDIWQKIHDKLADIWQSIIDTVITPKTQETYDKITAKIEEARQWIEDQIENWKTVAKDLIQGLIDGVLKKAGDFIDSVTTAVEDAIAEAKKKLGIESPSSVFNDIGANMMQGLINGVLGKIPAVAAAIIKAIADGIAKALASLGLGGGGGGSGGGGGGGGGQTPQGFAANVKKAMQLPNLAITQAVSASVMGAQMVAAPSVMRNTSVQFGDVNVNNGMEYQLLMATIRQVVREEL